MGRRVTTDDYEETDSWIERMREKLFREDGEEEDTPPEPPKEPASKLAEGIDPALVDEFFEAVGRDDIVSINRLLGQTPNLVYAVDEKSGWTALLFAARDNKPEIVEALLDKGADFNVLGNVTEQGRWTALMLAARNNHIQIVKDLLTKGANVNVADVNKTTALKLAVLGRNAEMVKFLLVKGAAIDAKDSFGWTPLLYAARDGLTEIADLLLANRADPNAKDKDKWSALHLAARNGHKEIVEALLNKGVDPNATNNEGWSPLHLTARSGKNPEVVKLLLDRGANLRAKNGVGLSSLIGWNALALAKFRAKDKDNSPDDVAKIKEIVEILTEAGKRPSSKAKFQLNLGDRFQGAKSAFSGWRSRSKFSEFSWKPKMPDFRNIKITSLQKAVILFLALTVASTAFFMKGPGKTASQKPVPKPAARAQKAKASVLGQIGGAIAGLDKWIYGFNKAMSKKLPEPSFQLSQAMVPPSALRMELATPGKTTPDVQPLKSITSPAAPAAIRPTPENVQPQSPAASDAGENSDEEPQVAVTPKAPAAPAPDATPAPVQADKQAEKPENENAPNAPSTNDEAPKKQAAAPELKATGPDAKVFEKIIAGWSGDTKVWEEVKEENPDLVNGKIIPAVNRYRLNHAILDADGNIQYDENENILARVNRERDTDNPFNLRSEYGSPEKPLGQIDALLEQAKETGAKSTEAPVAGDKTSYTDPTARRAKQNLVYETETSQSLVLAVAANGSAAADAFRDNPSVSWNNVDLVQGAGFTSKLQAFGYDQAHLINDHYHVTQYKDFGNQLLIESAHRVSGHTAEILVGEKSVVLHKVAGNSSEQELRDRAQQVLDMAASKNWKGVAIDLSGAFKGQEEWIVAQAKSMGLRVGSPSFAPSFARPRSTAPAFVAA